MSEREGGREVGREGVGFGVMGVIFGFLLTAPIAQIVLQVNSLLFAFHHAGIPQNCHNWSSAAAALV